MFVKSVFLLCRLFWTGSNWSGLLWYGMNVYLTMDERVMNSLPTLFLLAS
jgi:hypothetical protein